MNCRRCGAPDAAYTDLPRGPYCARCHSAGVPTPLSAIVPGVFSSLWHAAIEAARAVRGIA